MCLGRTYQQPLVLQRVGASWWEFDVSAGRDLTLAPPVPHRHALCGWPFNTGQGEAVRLPGGKVQRSKVIRCSEGERTRAKLTTTATPSWTREVEAYR